MKITTSLKIIFSKNKKLYRALHTLLGFYPDNISLYRLAFMHRSYSEEHPSGMRLSNERLEYLGDAVLGAVVAEVLFKKFPYREEGFLTEMRSKIVNREHLNKLAQKIGVDHFMEGLVDSALLNRSVYGDAFEALIGAIYMDKGYAHARRFLCDRILKHHVDMDEMEGLDVNFKSKLINWAQRERKKVTFELIEEIMNGKKRMLRVRLLLDGNEVAQAEDFSKKRAEQIAAQKICKEMGIIE